MSERLHKTIFSYLDASYLNGHGGHHWFKVDGIQFDPGRIREAREGFDREIRDVITRHGFEDRLRDVAFFGVSKGAIMALDGVASGRWRIRCGRVLRLPSSHTHFAAEQPNSGAADT